MSPECASDSAEPCEAAVGDGLAGARLDRAAALLMPGGLRARRRCIVEGGVLVNGAPCREPARRVKSDDVLALATWDTADANPAKARLLGRDGDFCFLFKGAGLHSAALAGKGGDSLEARLHDLCAPVLKPGERPELLQRLDQGTSGIICAALSEASARSFRAAEATGSCEKLYLALLAGRLDAPVTAHWRLDTANRRITHVLDAEAEPLRRTDFLPLHVWECEACARLCARIDAGCDPRALTLAACRIRLGARHQIRAHAAALGHPLLGDARYAAPGAPAAAAERFFLHHGFLSWPGGRCTAPVPWPWLEECLPPEARLRVRDWLDIPD